MSNARHSNEYLSFEVDNKLFGIGLNNLNQIIESKELTEIPMASDLLEGIIHHEGSILPIINVNNWLGLKNSGSGERDNILIVELETGNENLKIGLKVDRVLEVVQFNNDQIQKVPEIGVSNTEYIQAAARYRDTFIMLIDANNMFSTEELASIKESGSDRTEKILEDISSESLANIYLNFSIGQENFAVDANKVVEILDIPEITSVPGSGTEMAGVVNIRGSILSVVDLRIKFNMEVTDKDYQAATVMVLEVHTDGKLQSVGAIVDSVTEIIEIDEKQISETVSLDLPYDPAYLTGVAKVNEQFIQILNVNKVLELDTIE